MFKVSELYYYSKITIITISLKMMLFEEVKTDEVNIPR